MKKYILKDKIAYVCHNLQEWAVFMNDPGRIVKKTQIDAFLVSTVFLGLDHNHSELGDPLLFETMIFAEDSSGDIPFDGADDALFGYMKRDSFWNDAEETHEKACESIRNRIEQAKAQSEGLVYKMIVTAEEEV